MKKSILLLSCLFALGSASPIARADEPSAPTAALTALKAAGFKVGNARGGGYDVDYTGVKTFDDAVFTHLTALGTVRSMSGDGAGINDAVLARIAKLPGLERFFVNGSTVTDEGLASLAAAEKLQHLGIHHGQKALTGKGLLALKDRPNFKSVEFGGMQGIDDQTVGYLAELPHLRSINIYHTMHTRASLPLLVKKNPLLESISLNPHFDPTRFTPADIAALAPLKNLRELSLNDMVLPYENGLEHVTKLAGLKKLSVEYSVYKDEDLAKLRAAMPALEIKSGSRAKEENRAAWDERVAKMNKAAGKTP